MAGTELLSNSYWIVCAPLIAFVLIIAFRNWVGMQGAWIGIVAMGYGLFHSIAIAVGIYNGSIPLPSQGLQGQYFESYITWFSVGNFDFQAGLLIDGLSAVMLVVVTLVALLVQVYSVSYMHGHKRFGRYFAYVNLFTFAMLLLVVANNLLQMFVGWELVGLCSYLLIGFDFERDAAAYAGRKAFITTKIADVGMYLGLLVVFNYLGTFNIPQLYQNLSSVQYAPWVIAAVPILLFIGAMGKSAQVPLHVWLPDAMEGPTPASALIHAATMVAAGVYLVARVFFFYEASPIAMDFVAWVGVITAVVAATMGLVSEDIKRVLAFSTVSQLGFMMAALGCGGYQAGMFHLATHAAFKALLFLCAGSVIHAVHTNDMWKMGGLMRKMPITAVAYFLATCSIAGVPFLTSGFYSKEEILIAAFDYNKIIFGLLAFAAMLTSFYMFRTWFLTFTGLPRDPEKYQHAHESPALMTIPLIILVFPSLLLGPFFYYNHNISKWITWGQGSAEPHGGTFFIAVSILVLVLGLVAALWIYFFKPTRHDMLAQKLAAAHKVLSKRLYFDELYLWFIGRVYHPLAKLMADVDYNVVDQGAVDGVGRLGKVFAWVGNIFDGSFIDKILVDGNGTVMDRAGRLFRRMQSGLAQSYLFWMAVGLVSMLVWLSHNYK